MTTHLNRWQERAGFFEQLRETLDRHQNLWVVLTMREDYVTALDPYTQLLPNRLRARYYMQRMATKAALAAIKKPAEQGGRPFASGVAESLVRNLSNIRVHGKDEPQSGQYVEPVQLQVVCYQLWENLQDSDHPAGEITEEDLQKAGDIDAALADFYEDSLKIVLQNRDSVDPIFALGSGDSHLNG